MFVELPHPAAATGTVAAAAPPAAARLLQRQVIDAFVRSGLK